MSDEITPELFREKAVEHRKLGLVLYADMLEAGAAALERCAELETQCRQRAHFEHNLMKRITEYHLRTEKAEERCAELDAIIHWYCNEHHPNCPKWTRDMTLRQRDALDRYVARQQPGDAGEAKSP